MLKDNFKNKEKGLTFIEVMIALSILVIGVLAILNVFPVAFSFEAGNQLETQGVFLAQEKIEEILSNSYEDIPIVNTLEELSAPFERFERKTVIDYVDSNLETAPDDTGLKMIKVKVYWDSPFGRTRDSLEFRTLSSRR